MELIIKPTGKCNFNCKFCSAHDIDICHPADNKVPEKLKEFIAKYKPNRLIITGGEPLMVDPEYYYELYEISDHTRIGITSNLKDFYLHPDKWTPLFREKWFGVSTSFNYGETRMWDKNTVYTEKMFLEVMDLFKERIGYTPDFISVIDESNEDLVMDHVLLAKSLGCKVKLNNAIPVGLQSKGYQRYQMFHHYIKIIEAGLDQYETNCAERAVSKCPRNINMVCESTIRCIHIDNNNEVHVSTCDEQSSLGNYLPDDKIYVPNDQVTPAVLPYEEYINEECPSCELFRLCNACTTNRFVAKQDPNYCEEMKKLEEKIIETGWLL